MVNEQAKNKSKTKPLNSITLKLMYPIEWGSETIDELTLFRPTAHDIEHLPEKPKMGDLTRIGLACAKQPYALAKKMDAADAVELAAKVGDFLEGSRGTGDIVSS